MINDSEPIIIECVHNKGNQTIPISMLIITQEGKECNTVVILFYS